MRTADLGDFILLIPASSTLAGQARVSSGAVLRRIGAAIAAQLESAGPFEEWAARCLVRNAEARVTAGELLCSYLRWCDLAQIEHEARLNATSFGRRLTALGIGRTKNASGRVIRLGCALDLAADAEINRQLQTDRQLGAQPSFWSGGGD